MRHGLTLALATLLAASACSSSQRPQPVAQADTPPTPPPAPTPDLSPVPVPRGAIATVRVDSLRGEARRFGALSGLGDAANEILDGALPEIVGGESMLPLLDRDGPVDLFFFFDGPRNTPRGAFAFAAVPYEQAVARASDGFTLRAEGEARQRWQRVVDRGRGERGDPRWIAPAAGPEGSARLVVSERGVATETILSTVGPYLTRTLAASPVSPAEGNIVIDVHVPQIREVVDVDLRHELDRAVSDLTPGPDPNDAAFEGAIQRWISDALQAVPTTLAEVDAARVALSLGDYGTRVTATATARRPSAAIAQQMVAAVHGQRAPVDLLARMPPGASFYSASAASLEPLRATLNLASSAIARALVPRSRLVEPDRTALRTALASLFAQDRVRVASAAGRDAANHYWNVSLAELTTPPRQFVSNVRELVTALRRFGVARAMRLDKHVDPARWTVLPALANGTVGPGVPAGSLLVRIPPASLRAPTPPPRPGAPRPAALDNTPIELLFVPDGSRLWVVMAPDARAKLREAMAEHPAPVTVEGADAEGVFGVAAIFPGLVDALLQDETQMLRRWREVTAQSQGSPVATLVTSLRAEGEALHPSAVLSIPASAHALIGRMLNQGNAPPHP